MYCVTVTDQDYSFKSKLIFEVPAFDMSAFWLWCQTDNTWMFITCTALSIVGPTLLTRHILSVSYFILILTVLLIVNSGPKFCFFFYCSSRYNRVKKNQLDAQLILSIFRQPLHVSGVSRPIIRRYKRMYTKVGTYYSL